MKKITFLFVILLMAMMASVSKVSAQTQLSTPTVGTATLITAVGFTANWTPGDASATSFDVKVYDATPTLVKTVNVTGAATATAAITGLNASTAYTFTVTAKGDGVVFTNSLESSPASVSTVAFITLATPSLGTASRVTLTGFTANWTAVANATSYDVNVYQGGTLATGSPKNVSGATSATLAIIGLLAPATTYTYTITAKGDGVIYSNSTPSSGSATFTTPTSGSFLLQYADVDAMTLNSDIKAGAADIYELTTSGGAYTMNTGSTSNNNTFIRSSTVRALAGLAAKPIIKVISSTTGSTANLFNVNTPNMTFRFDGLELSGLNTSPGAAQLMMFLAGTATTTTNIKIYITNCLLHDFQNVGGNGIIRLDGTSGGLIDIQGSTIYNFGGRALFLNTGNTNDVINLKNCTFYKNSLQGSRADIIYNAAASGTWLGTINIDHCTFHHIVATSAAECVFRTTTFATGGICSITNSLFTDIDGAALASNLTVSGSYVAGYKKAPLGTVTNSFAATPTPIYVDSINANPALFNLRLTNPASFICGDGLVAGNTYNTILATPSVTAGSNVTSGGFTANWTPVANASSYNVNVYQGSTFISTTNASGQSASSLAITGLSVSTAYTYNVIAKGDGIYYFDSTPSLASAPLTTDIGTGVNQIGNISFVTVTGKKIVCSEIGTLQLYNLQGALVLSVKNVSEVNTNLRSGIYLLRFTNQAGMQLIQKIAIQ